MMAPAMAAIVHERAIFETVFRCLLAKSCNVTSDIVLATC